MCFFIFPLASVYTYIILLSMCNVCKNTNFSYSTDLYGADQTIRVNVGTEEELRQQNKVCGSYLDRHTHSKSLS